jgi:predicted DCC family thiol-disulfide oxidoreductase YuxK
MNYTVLFDGQCEVCQAFYSWLRALDKNQRSVGLPLEDANLSALNPKLLMDECLKELHVVESSGKIYQGWEACVVLAKLSPWTWVIGFLGDFPPFSWLGMFLYNWVAKNRYLISKCRGERAGFLKARHCKRSLVFSRFGRVTFLALLCGHLSAFGMAFRRD